MAMNAAVAATKTAAPPIASGVRPPWPPSISARANAASASTPASWAAGSRLRGQALGAGAYWAVRTMAASPIGTLMKNTSRQLAGDQDSAEDRTGRGGDAG